MAQLSCRVPARLDDKLEAVAADRDVFKSEIVRQAIRHYVRENPDGFAAFSHGSRRNQDVVEGDRAPTGGIYDPLEDRQ